MSQEPNGQELRGGAAITALAPQVSQASVPKPIQYFRGYFLMRSRDPLDTEKIHIGAQNVVLELEREKEYTLPESFWSVAKDGVMRTQRIDPETKRAITVSRQTYPFTIVSRDGKEEDFRKLLTDLSHGQG